MTFENKLKYWYLKTLESQIESDGFFKVEEANFWFLALDIRRKES